jgi:hypothetical protein
MMSWIFVGSNRFFLILVSFDQAKEKKKEAYDQSSPKERAGASSKKIIVFSNLFSAKYYFAALRNNAIIQKALHIKISTL